MSCGLIIKLSNVQLELVLTLVDRDTGSVMSLFLKIIFLTMTYLHYELHWIIREIRVNMIWTGGNIVKSDSNHL
jgi:hypothetical protein